VRVFNFSGDGFRGLHWKTTASSEMLLGVELHRFIDSFTDEHELTKKAKALLRPKAKRTASIALDLLGDYFLHKHWETMRVMQDHSTSLTVEHFINSMITEIDTHRSLLVGKASHMAPYLTSENWLMSYQTLDGIGHAAQGMALRHPAVKDLPLFFKQLDSGDYQIAEQWFLEFYPKLMQACQQWTLAHPAHKMLSLS